jgi:hypothetical protein
MHCLAAWIWSQHRGRHSSMYVAVELLKNCAASATHKFEGSKFDDRGWLSWTVVGGTLPEELNHLSVFA